MADRGLARGSLDPRADAAGLERLFDHAFGRAEPDDLERTHAALVVQRGEIVAERYAPDVAPDDTHASWSMAKSITNALVGILVRQGRVDVSQPIPVPEWAGTTRGGASRSTRCSAWWMACASARPSTWAAARSATTPSRSRT